MSTRAERKMNRSLGLTSRDNKISECSFCKRQIFGHKEPSIVKGKMMLFCDNCSDLALLFEKEK
jgi:hypothetical protein